MSKLFASAACLGGIVKDFSTTGSAQTEGLMRNARNNTVAKKIN
jgi:hypothetical protein